MLGPYDLHLNISNTFSLKSGLSNFDLKIKI